MDIFSLASVFLVCFGFFPGCHGYNKTLYAGVEAQNKLFEDLFKSYDKRVRPVMKPTEPVHASFGLGLQALLYLDEEHEYMDLLTYMLVSWHDGRLAWNTSQRMGIDLLTVPAAQIWTPDFVPFSSIDEDVHLMETKAMVFASGHVSWIPTLHLRSPCKVNLKQFPFDQQVCTVTFASYVHHGNHLNMTFFGDTPEAALDTTNDYRPNSNWALTDKRCELKVMHYSCCPEPYPQMEVTLTFKRNPNYYVHVFVLPALMVGVLVPISLLMPPEAKERITLGSVILLGLILLMTNLSAVLPAAHRQLPALTMYYTLTMLWCLLSILCSIFILNLYNRGPRRGKVPDTVRWIFLRSLKRLVCLGSDSYYPLSDMDAISMRGLDKALNTSGNGQERQPTGGLDARGNSNPPTKMERDLEEVTKNLNLFVARTSLQDAHQEILNEWRQVALVFDRVLFFFFFLIFLMCSVVLLA